MWQWRLGRELGALDGSGRRYRLLQGSPSSTPFRRLVVFRRGEIHVHIRFDDGDRFGRLALAQTGAMEGPLRSLDDLNLVFPLVVIDHLPSSDRFYSAWAPTMQSPTVSVAKFLQKLHESP